jgi:threonine dehydrogenase-like Zn-dependent dehydrogenase
MHAADDARVTDHADPRIVEPTDAIVRLTATCICGSDLWPYRGVEPWVKGFLGISTPDSQISMPMPYS